MITITIDTLAGETLNSVMKALGYEAHEKPVQPSTTDALVYPTTLHEAVAVAEGGDAKDPAPEAEPAKRKRRTKAEMEADAARIPSPPSASQAEPVPPALHAVPDATIYEVRRYGGELDSEHVVLDYAITRLEYLIAEAGDTEALESLSRANEGLTDTLPAAKSERVQAAFEAAFVAASKPAVTTPVDTGGWPFGQDGKPLRRVPLTPQGARDVVMAIVGGTEPKYGMAAASALISKHGVAKLSALPEGSPVFALVAQEGADLLGLPTVSVSLV